MKQHKDIKKNTVVVKTGKEPAAASVRGVSVKKIKNEGQISNGDKLKLLLIVLLLVLSLWSFNHFKISFPALAVASPLAAIVVGLIIICCWCSFGRALVNYIIEATAEVKKIVWPDRKTAGRMTLLVMVFVVILALYMWLADSFLQWLLYDLILRRGN